MPHLADRAGNQKVPGNTGRNQWGSRRNTRAAEHFLLGGEDGEFQLTDGGIGDLHADLKSLFFAQYIVEAKENFCEKKLAIVEDPKKGFEGTVGSL